MKCNASDKQIEAMQCNMQCYTIYAIQYMEYNTYTSDKQMPRALPHTSLNLNQGAVFQHKMCLLLGDRGGVGGRCYNMYNSALAQTRGHRK